MGLLTRILGKSDGKPTDSQKRGLAGEAAAARCLRKKGMKVLVQRYRCKFGEIDLVARDGDTLVFVEVKTRRSAEHGAPFEAVTSEKQRHISRVALDYLRRLGNPEIPVRFDIVEVIDSGGGLECEHIPNAFGLAEPYIY